MKTTTTNATVSSFALVPTTDVQRHWLKFVTDIEKMSDRRYYIHVGKNFIVEITICEHDLTSKHDLMNVWHKAGYITEKLPTHISIDTYFTDDNGNCWGYYNPTIKLSDDGKRSVVDFEFLREYTPENAAELIAEAIRMYEMDIRH